MVSGAVVANLTRPLARRGAVFDGVDDFVDVAHNANQLGANLTGGFTISAWVNPKSTGETGAGKILDKSTADGGADGFTYRIDANKKAVLQINLGTSIRSADSSLPFGKWTHVLTTITSAQIAQHYINGAVSGSAGDLVQGISAMTTTNDIRIGNLTGNTNRTWDGAISQVKMWNRVLNSTEIAADLAGKEVAGTIIDVPLQENYDDVTNSGSRLAAIDDQVASAVSGARVTASDQYMIAVHGDKILTTVVEEAP